MKSFPSLSENHELQRTVAAIRDELGAVQAHVLFHLLPGGIAIEAGNYVDYILAKHELTRRGLNATLL